MHLLYTKGALAAAAFVITSPAFAQTGGGAGTTQSPSATSGNVAGTASGATGADADKQNTQNMIHGDPNAYKQNTQNMIHGDPDAYKQKTQNMIHGDPTQGKQN